jgi:hypothetical protein
LPKKNDSSKRDSWKVITFLCLTSKLMKRVILNGIESRERTNRFWERAKLQ